MKKIFFLSFISCSLLLCKSKTFGQWQLTGNGNATATSILGTTHAIPLNLTTNNVRRLVIDANGKIGIGTATPVNILTVKGVGSKPAASWVTTGNPVFVGFGETALGNADCIAAMASTFKNGRPVFVGRRSRGTLAVPTTMANNDFIMSVLASAHDGTAFQNSATIDFLVDGTPSAGNVPARISFVTGSNSTNRTERLRIGNTGDITFNTNQFTINNTTRRVGMNTVHPAALLDLKTYNPAQPTITDGLLIPQVNAFAVQRPTALQHGMMVFLNQPSVSGDQPGFYYWDNPALKWKSIATGSDAGNNAWSIKGNAGTNANTDFIGTTDATDLHFRVNNVKAGLIGYDPNFAETSFGYQALSNSTGGGNAAFGYRSQVYNTYGYANTSIGRFSMEKNIGGYSNTAVGSESLRQNEDGYFNTAIGQVALGSTTSFDNTALGRYALLTATTGNSNTALGSAANLNDVTLSNVTLLGFYTVGTADNSVQLGNNAVTSVKAANNIVIVSDGRFKKNVEKNVPGLAFINALQPVTYNYDVAALDQFERTGMPELKGNDKMIADKSMKQYTAALHRKEAIRYSGFVAQDVEKIANKLGYDFSGVYKPQNDKEPYGLSYAEFVVPLVKAVQELSIKNEELGMKNEALKANDGALQQQVNNQQHQIDDLKAIVLKLMNNQTAAPCPTLAGK